MATSYQIKESVIRSINRGEENSFKILYDSYYTYLCTYATSYIFDPEKAKEIVNDTFISIWAKRETLIYPIHGYLQKCIQNGCLNHIRTLKSQQSFLDKYKEDLFSYQEECCLTDITPLDALEISELEQQVRDSIKSLPEKCRVIFEKYLYAGKSPKEIAEELGISVNTVRVQIKIALDKIKLHLGPILGILILFFPKK